MLKTSIRIKHLSNTKKHILIPFTKTSSIMSHLRCRTPPSMFREKKNKTTTKKIEVKIQQKDFLLFILIPP